MKLYQALKKKNALAAQIKEVSSLIRENNQMAIPTDVNAPVVFEFDMDNLLHQYDNQIECCRKGLSLMPDPLKEPWLPCRKYFSY